MHHSDHQVPVPALFRVVRLPAHGSIMIGFVLALGPECFPDADSFDVVFDVSDIISACWWLAEAICLSSQLLKITIYFETLELFGGSRIPRNFIVPASFVWELLIKPRVISFETPVRSDLFKNIFVFNNRSRLIVLDGVPFSPVNFIFIGFLRQKRVHSEGGASALGAENHRAGLLAVWEVKLAVCPYIFPEIIRGANGILR